APCYRGPVIYVKDASNAPQVCSRLLHPQLRRQYVTSVKHEQNTLYDHYIEREKKVEIVPLEIARKNKYKNEWKDYRPPKPNLLCKEFLLETTVEKIRDYIDWSHFFHSWGFTLPYPEVFFHSKEGEEAEKLFKDTTEILDDLNIKKLIKPKGIVKFLLANTFNFEEVRVFTDDTRKESIGKFFFLRQQVKKNEEQTFYSLADFIAPIESNLMDYIGIFVVTAGDVSALSNHFSSRGEEYKSVIIRLIADRIAEALSEYLHLIVRKELWGYSPDENLSIDEIFKGKYCGIRPAPGYPATPDHSAKELIFDILSVKEKLGLNLTENYSIYPPSSVCGFYFSHPKSQYFSIGRIGKDQIQQYADSLGVSTSTAERNLGLVMI
ncbi:MAG: hypothetical protein N2053_10810, partial [Chitinispirillaceae bacterium]|nr:hypothetical protein [Chitinispirillaceae bacterium]